MQPLMTKISRRCRWLWNDLWYKCVPLTYWQRQRGQRIFVYYRLDFRCSRDYNARFIDADYFEKQLTFYKKHFYVASLEDYLKGNYSTDCFVVALTFDDGYLINLYIVLPLLEKYQMFATFFVTSLRSAGDNILRSDHLDLGVEISSSEIGVCGRYFKKQKGNPLTLKPGNH